MVRINIEASAAMAEWIPLAPPRLATIYSEDPDRLASALEVQPAEAGANILVLRPYDAVVFERTWSAEGLAFAALSQVAACR
jgi:hypothetical protein